MEEKIYNVILKVDTDYEKFWIDMERITNIDGIPNREAEVANRREGSLRQTWYYLTEEEVELVKQHPDVLDVEIPPDFRDDITMNLDRIQTGTFTRLASDSKLHDNYGLLRCSLATNTYENSLLIDDDYRYTLDGTGVDIVIQDSGVDGTHPEFSGSDGQYRIVNTDWATLSGLSFSNSANNLTDYDGHGTHVAGTAAGLIFGHAKNAMIYPQKLDDLKGPGDPTSGVSVTYAFDSIKLWHRNKPIDPKTGFKRPTIVNMSWGYGFSIPIGTRTVVFRGATTSSINSNQAAIAGVNTYSTLTFQVGARISSVDTDVDELIAEGVHVFISAGNRNLKIDKPNGKDYNNTISAGTPRYYHRGTSPYSLNAFNVGATDSLVTGSGANAKEMKAAYSESGPGVDIYAPGSRIISCIPSSSASGYPYRLLSTPYKQLSKSGTSMASPQVAGVAALYCQVTPGITPMHLKTAILTHSTPLIYDNTFFDRALSNSHNLQGSSKRFLRNIYAGKDQTVEVKGDISIPFGNIKLNS
jgi:subtilisin family serine protease